MANITKINVDEIDYKIQGTLYDSLGDNVDGAITQKANSAILNKLDSNVTNKVILTATGTTVVGQTLWLVDWTDVNIPAGTTVIVVKNSNLNYSNGQCYMQWNESSTSTRKLIYTNRRNEYTFSVDVTKIRFWIQSNNYVEDVSLTLYIKGLRNEYDDLVIDYNKTKSEKIDAIGEVVFNRTITVMDIDTITNEIVPTTSIETIPAGTILEFEKIGESTTKFYINGDAGHEFNDGKTYKLLADLTSFRIAVPKDSGIEGEEVSVIVRRKGSMQKNIEDVEADVNLIENTLFTSQLFEFNDIPSEGSYSNNSKCFFNSNVNIPAGSVIRINVSSIGSGKAITNWVYKLNDDSTISKKDSTYDIELLSDATVLRVYTLASYIQDDSEPITVTGTVISSLDKMKENIDSFKEFEESLGGIKNKNLFDFTGDISNTSDFPRPFAKNPFFNQKVNIPIGSKVAINMVQGFGTVVNKWYYSTGGKGKAITSTSIELTSTAEEPINTLKVYFNNNNGEIPNPDQSGIIHITINIIGEIPDIISRISALENSGQGGTFDFNTSYVLSNYASDPDEGRFDSGTYTFVIRKSAHANKNMIISSFAKYVVISGSSTNEVPIIRFQYNDSNNSAIYTSTKYTIGNKDTFESKEWRIPHFFENSTLTVTIIVPENITLYINEISNRYSDVVNRNSVGYRMNAHLQLFNFNTLRGITESAKLGYPCCIVVPKRTSDGVWVCFHDDDNINNLRYVENPSQRVCWLQDGVYNRYDVNGNKIGEGAMPISSIDFETLQNYCYTSNYDGNRERVPTLEDFLLVCAKTGMHPMFSCHGQSPSTFSQVKELVNKYGLLKYLNIKTAFNSSDHKTTLNSFYNVFGYEIESYAGDVSSDTDINSIISWLDATNAGQNKDKVRVGLELFSNRLGSDNSKVLAIRDAGYFAAIADISSGADEAMTAEQIEYWIRQGVTEWTEYRMFSYGLNW